MAINSLGVKKVGGVSQRAGHVGGGVGARGTARLALAAGLALSVTGASLLAEPATTVNPATPATSTTPTTPTPPTTPAPPTTPTTPATTQPAAPAPGAPTGGTFVVGSGAAGQGRIAARPGAQQRLARGPTKPAMIELEELARQPRIRVARTLPQMAGQPAPAVATATAAAAAADGARVMIPEGPRKRPAGLDIRAALVPSAEPSELKPSTPQLNWPKVSVPVLATVEGGSNATVTQVLAPPTVATVTPIEVGGGALLGAAPQSDAPVVEPVIVVGGGGVREISSTMAIAPSTVEPAMPILAPMVAQVASPLLAEPATPMVAQVASPVLAEPAAPMVAQVASPVLAEPAAPMVAQVVAPISAPFELVQIAPAAVPLVAVPDERPVVLARGDSVRPSPVVLDAGTTRAMHREPITARASSERLRSSEPSVRPGVSGGGATQVPPAIAPLPKLRFPAQPVQPVWTPTVITLAEPVPVAVPVPEPVLAPVIVEAPVLAPVRSEFDPKLTAALPSALSGMSGPLVQATPLVLAPVVLAPVMLAPEVVALEPNMPEPVAVTAEIAPPQFAAAPAGASAPLTPSTPSTSPTTSTPFSPTLARMPGQTIATSREAAGESTLALPCLASDPALKGIAVLPAPASSSERPGTDAFAALVPEPIPHLPAGGPASEPSSASTGTDTGGPRLGGDGRRSSMSVKPPVSDDPFAAAVAAAGKGLASVPTAALRPEIEPASVPAPFESLVPLASLAPLAPLAPSAPIAASPARAAESVTIAAPEQAAVAAAPDLPVLARASERLGNDVKPAPAAGSALDPFSASGRQVAMRVVELSGTPGMVQVLTEGGTDWRLAELNQESSGKFTLRTGGDAGALVLLDGQARLRVGRLSRVDVRSMNAGPGAGSGGGPGAIGSGGALGGSSAGERRVVVALTRGRVAVIPGPGQMVNVYTPQSLIAVREPTEIIHDTASGTRTLPYDPKGVAEVPTP